MASTPKTMSSRLMTMKFMQRSAAKSVSSEPSTPRGPPSKKVRLSSGGSAPGTPGTPSDHEIIQSALAAEEKKRADALEKAAAQSGETKWVLSFQNPQAGSRRSTMNIRQAGYATIDADDDTDDEETKPARMQFGGGLKKKEKPAAPKDTEESDEETTSSSGDLDSDDPTAELIRETKREYAAKDREARKMQKGAQAKRQSLPFNEDMDLGGLESLSGPRKTGLSRDTGGMKCFSCGKTGHKKTDCPNPSTPRGPSGRGRGSGGRGRR